MSSSASGSESGSLLDFGMMDPSLSLAIKQPHWEDDAEEFYDEIDPGGEETCSEGYSSQMEEDFLAQNGGYMNPWVAMEA